MAQPLDKIIAEGRLQEIPGIGRAIADIVTKLYNTGTHPSLEALREEIPAGVLEMMAIPGLRPEKVLKLYKTLAISSLAELEKAAREDRIKDTKGLEPALQAKILENLDLSRSSGRHMHRAAALLETAKYNLQAAHPELKKITIAGDLRRGCELVSDLSLVAETPRLAKGPTTLPRFGEVKVHLAGRRHYGITLLLATGSNKHLEALSAHANAKGLTLDDQGLRRGTIIIAARTEESIYEALGLPLHRARAARNRRGGRAGAKGRSAQIGY